VHYGTHQPRAEGARLPRRSTWASRQASLIRANRFDELDLAHIADELDDLAGNLSAGSKTSSRCCLTTVPTQFGKAA
jgi:hypothetical protein